MDTRNKTVECTVSVTINDEIKNIRIRHNEQMWEARIRVNDKTVDVKSKKIPNGGALFFEQDGANVIITILKEKDEYVYDCFVNEVSVKDDMPWKLGKYEFPDVLKWKTVLEKGLIKYVITEGVKGAIVGSFIFLLLVVFKFLFPNFLESINLLVYFFISIIPLAVFYALLSPAEFKAGEKSLKEYNSYREEIIEETSLQEVAMKDETIEDILSDIEDITK